MELRFMCLICFAYFIGYKTVVVEGACNSGEWSCADGSCIDEKLKCNGAYNCDDKTDETFVLCRETPCDFWKEFRCAYGACLKDKSLICNGARDCVDNSDEYLPQCRNETGYFECVSRNLTGCFERESTCKDGTKFDRYIKCNGVMDCYDKSDENVESCADSWIPLCIGWYFRCAYGGCILHEKVCNGVIDCFDGSDELGGLCDNYVPKEKLFNKMEIWNCKDGNRIPLKLKCNGQEDCPDGSDETISECRKSIHCPSNYTKCVYGACVLESALCDGKMDCADNSDELLQECRNEITYKECVDRVNNKSLVEKSPELRKHYDDQLMTCEIEEKSCDNGQLLENIEQKCDGKIDCDDGSDETLETCATKRGNGDCKFRCRSGACIASNKICNKVKDCFDGSDELDELCYDGKCVLPEYPAHGTYIVQDQDAAPGQKLDVALLVYTCDVGYKMHGTSRYVNCLKGNWPYKPPQCLAQCKLPKHPSTIYWCLPQGPLAGQEERQCNEAVPAGATVRPECSAAIYHYVGVLSFLHCQDNGEWNRPVPTCYAPAHCFWSDIQKTLPARFFAVALGKLYRPWNDPYDVDAQKLNVRAIKIPPRFKGAATNLQEDIALLFLSPPAAYRAHVLPVCLDFSPTFERRQLYTGNLGKVAGWGLTSEDGKAAPVLRTAKLPFLDINACFEQSPSDFYKFISGDKFCAGSATSQALCQGDSGGGLVFPSRVNGEERYYLRGVVSAAPRNGHLCNAYIHTTFTLVSRHQSFILESWNSAE